MGNENLPVWASILLVGFIAGLLFGVGIETGISPDEAGISLFVMKTFCKATEYLEGSTQFNCGGLIAIMSLLTILIGIGAILEESARMDNWIVGLILYGVGWVVGLIYILVN